MGRIKLTPRYAFQAPEGYVYISSDYSAMETRISGAIAAVAKLIELYKLEKQYDLGQIPRPQDPEGNEYNDPMIDCHIVSAMALSKDVARIVKETPWLANKNNPIVAEERHKGKTLSFQVIFGGAASAIAEAIKCTVEEAEDLLKKFFGRETGFWELEREIKSTGNIAKEQGWVRSATGRIVFVKNGASME